MSRVLQAAQWHAVSCLGFLLFAAWPAVSGAQLSAIDRDGWYSWDTPAVDDLPGWCCFEMRDGGPARRPCDLDKAQGFGSDSDAPPMGRLLRVYAKIEDGKPVAARALSEACPVRVQGDIAHLGEVASADSVGWLSVALERNKKSMSSSAIAAIAAHAGTAAFEKMVALSRPDMPADIRKESVFWMTQTRARESAATVRGVMFEDGDAKLRLHAAFSLSQTDLDGVDDALINLGRKDADDSVRAGAWFWLAQMGSAKSEVAIAGAIAGDVSGRVREEAVFALSQLPDGRATPALIAVLEDRAVGKPEREKALFWLAQSGSDDAFEYLEAVISG